MISKMEQLYKRHFGLKEPPFNITPDPSFLYASASHREGLAQLLYGVTARRGFIVLTGEVGTGKTTLIQSLLHQLNDQTQTAFVFSAISSPLDLLRSVCEEFKLVQPLREVRDFHHYSGLLNEFLLAKYQNSENAALIIDEAQNLSAPVLESIRLLSNFETTKDKLLQILLVGQPELADRLNTPELRQLRQRITLRHHLRPLSGDECHEYVANRLVHAGGNREIFPKKTLESVFRYSGGVPRLINIICDNALLNAYAVGQKIIDSKCIEEVANDLCLTPLSSRVTVMQRESSAAAEPRSVSRPEVIKPNAVAIQSRYRSFSTFTSDQPIATRNEILPPAFLTLVSDALIDAMGPMGRVVLADQIKRLGYSMERFPRDKFETLLKTVGAEIFNDVLGERFHQTMSKAFRNLKTAEKETL